MKVKLGLVFVSKTISTFIRREVKEGKQSRYPEG
jgi:hypothetical protein